MSLHYWDMVDGDDTVLWKFSIVYAVCGGRKNFSEVVAERGELEPSGVTQFIGSGDSGSVDGMEERYRMMLSALEERKTASSSREQTRSTALPLMRHWLS